MHELIEQHRTVVAELCRRYRVRRLEVFGSAARGVDFDPERSDIDSLVEFDTTRGAPTLDEFFGLWDDLASVFRRPVDLVMAGSLSLPSLRAS